jgi:D-xylose reductase
VLLRWATQRGIAVIPKSNDQGRLVQNLAATDFDLSPQELAEISSLNRGLRFVAILPSLLLCMFLTRHSNSFNDPADIDPRLAIFA